MGSGDGVFGRRGSRGARRGVAVAVAVAAFWGVLGASVSAQVTAPSDGEQLGDVWVLVGGTVEVDIVSAFVGTVDTYTARSQQTSLATATLAGSTVTVTGVAAGTVLIELQAANTAGSEWASFDVTVVDADDAPVARCCFDSGQPVAGGADVVWDAAQRFMGPVDSYAVSVDLSLPFGSGSGPVVRARVSDSIITVTPLRRGLANLTITATNTNGTTTLSASLIVAPAAPRTTGTLAARTLTVGASIDVDVAAGFTGTVDTYGATSSDTTIVTVTTTGSTMTLSGVAAGSATVTVTATNTTGRATQTIAVTITPDPAAPQSTGTLAARTLTVGASIDVDVAAAFTGTVDTYGATSSDTAVVTVSTTGSVVSLSGVAAGSATVTVTAVNTAGRATQTIAATVAAALAAPTATGTLAARTLTAGASVDVDVAAAFTGTVDTYGATSSDTAVVTVSTTGSVLTLSGVAAGTATVTVVATNTGGRATQTIAVTVAAALAAPTASGTLAAQTLTAGTSVDVDVAGAFAGTVDTYTATSSNGAVLDIALAGSTVTLVGVAAGTATVTVTAANTGGNATQTLAVTVNLPPAPTLGAELAEQTLQVTETLTVDVAAGFNGRIDTYTAVSGDTDTLTVTADGSAVSLTGVAVGSTTVTVTAINAAGRAARSFTVTVGALTAPQTAATPLARTIAVGEELPIHIADAFGGIVATYGATSSDTTITTVSVDGSTVTLTGIAAGTATITLQAINAAGRATTTLPVTVTEPETLTIAVAAPSHCLGSEGTLAPGGGRRGVGHINITYHITGGAGPYTITSPDTPQTANTPTGTLTIPCSQRGIDLTTATPDTNVVEAGPRTLTLTATDNNNNTTTTNIEIEVAENAYTTEYNNGQMHPEKTYILGTPTQWVLITLPPGLTLQFEGLSPNNMAHFTEPTTGTQIILDWTTGAELGRHTPSDTTTTTRTTRNTNTRQARIAAALAIKTPTGLTYGAKGPDWRPYPDLPDSKDPVNTQVAVHPNMLNGEGIRVCADTTSSAVKENVKLAAKEWNDKIKARNPQFPRDVFEYILRCDDGNIDVTVEVTLERLISNSDKCVRMVKACAQIIVSGNNPPTITGDTIFAIPSRSVAREAMVHELGHFLGLGDYFNKNNSKCTNPSSAAIKKQFASVMAGGECRRIAVEGREVQGRDLDDLHAVYNPGPRADMYFSAHGLGSWRLYAGSPPADKAEADVGGPFYVSNAERYVIFRRVVGSRYAWEYQGWFTRDLAGEWLLPGLVPGNDYRYWLPLVGTLDEITGKEFAVVGITGGDTEQTSSRQVEGHATWRFEFSDSEWSLGPPAFVYGPPSKPTNVSATAGTDVVLLSWSSVPGATDYFVYVYRSGTTTRLQAVHVDADPSVCSAHATISGLTRRLLYDFRVEAARRGVSMRSELSERVTARLLAGGTNPRGAGEGARSGGADAGTSGASSAPSGSCIPNPPVVEPDVEESAECPTDGQDWNRVAVGEGFVCERLDSVSALPGVSVVSCPTGPSVVPAYTRVSVGGVEKCRRVLEAAPTESLGDPECEDGFVPVSGGASCSRTDSVPATPTPECPDGYTLVSLGVPFCFDSVPASATTIPECADGYTLVTSGSASCVSSVPATEVATPWCPAPYSLVNLGVPFCFDSVSASATTIYECPDGYRLATLLVGGGISRVCRKTVAATESVAYSCDAGYTLVNLGVPFCYRSVPATPSTTYSCPAGYSLVTTIVGGGISRYCRRTVAATATYSCDSGYTLSGTTCYKYLYATPTGGTCPAGYTVFFNGFAHLCRKRVTTTATVTYSCDSGYTLSGSTCTRTVVPTATVTYSCASGYALSGQTCTRSVAPTASTTYSCPSGYTLSGSTCTHTTTPTSRVVYDCDDAPAGYTLSGSNCTHSTTPNFRTSYHCNDAPPGHTLSGSNCTDSVAPTSRVVYDCDDAPAGYRLSGSNCTDSVAPTTSYHCNDAPPGYTLSGTDCVKITTQAPTRPTIYTCPATYTRVEPTDNPTGPPTCTKIDIINATTTTTPASCPAVRPTEPLYQLQQDRLAGTTERTCERTLTTPAIITKTYTCPTGYKLERTTNAQDTDAQDTKHTCRLNPPTTPNT